MDINEFVKGLEDSVIKDEIKKLGNTPEGQRLLKSITPQDKQNLLNQMGKLNAKGISNDMLAKSLKNPDVLKQLSAMLNKKR